MRNAIEFAWYGAHLCLDEANTQYLATALTTGADISAWAALLFPEVKSKVVIAIAAATAKVGAGAIKLVDLKGGSQGVCFTLAWASVPAVGPVVWVKAQ